MLPRKQLAPLKSEFERIRASGKMYDSPSFGLIAAYSLQTTTNLGAQVAFIVSKKIDKSSVGRHEVKRKLSDGVSPFVPRLAKNLQLVFLAKKNGINASKEQLTIEIEEVLKRAKLLA